MGRAALDERHERAFHGSVTPMVESPRVLTLRRVGDWRGLRRLTHGRRAYEVSLSDGSRRRVSRSELDKMLDARKYPADVWACMQTADDAWTAGDDSFLEWPSGLPLRP